MVLVAAELAVPIVAERTGSTPWHPHHITERYGLFTLIVMGEARALRFATEHDLPCLLRVRAGGEVRTRLSPRLESWA